MIEALKVLPHSYESEVALLNCIFMDENIFFELKLDYTYFYDKTNSEIYKAIQELSSENKHWDIVAISWDLWPRETDRLFEISRSIYQNNWQDYENTIMGTYIRRKIIQYLQTITANCYEYDVEVIQSKLQKLYDFTIIEKQLEFIDEIDWFIWDLENWNNIVVSSWYNEIDNTIRWFKQWQLVTVAWRPWMWKTSFMLNMMYKQTRKGIKTIFFSLEMWNREISYRLVSLETWIEYWIIDSWLSKRNESQRWIIENWFWTIKEKNLKIYDKIFSLESIKSQIKREKIKNWLDVVFIDYIWLMEQKDRSIMRSVFIWQITRELKKLAKQENITIIIWSQLNREIEKRLNKEPNLADLRESWDIEQDSDIVIFIDRDLEIEKHQPFNIYIKKYRNWKTWNIELEFRQGTMEILDKKRQFEVEKPKRIPKENDDSNFIF